MSKERDPFYGYSSCPDKCLNYISHYDKNQTIWKEKSENIIREFISKLDSFRNFHDAYSFLAHRRHDVAKELKHGHEEGKTANYGNFRKEDDHFRQNISAGDGEHFWKWQKKKIFELTRELASSIRNVNLSDNTIKYFFEDAYKTCLQENVIVEDLRASYFCIMIKFPEDNERPDFSHADFLSTIELYELQKEPTQDLIRIEYAPVSHLFIKNHYQIANYYYQGLLNWSQHESVSGFLGNAAKLFYLIAHLLPLKQGNCSVMEWMLRAIAFKNGIELGYFNYAEKISWDFKAVLTPDWNDYTKWFAEKLFENYKLFETGNDKDLFFFK